MTEDGQPRATTPCRRRDCRDTPLSRGLCAEHWARWNSGADELDMADDDEPAPPAKVWWPPKRAGGAVSDTARMIMHNRRQATP